MVQNEVKEVALTEREGSYGRGGGEARGSQWKHEEIHYIVDVITLYHWFVSTTTEFIQQAHQSPPISTASPPRRERETLTKYTLRNHSLTPDQQTWQPSEMWQKQMARMAPSPWAHLTLYRESLCFVTHSEAHGRCVGARNFYIDLKLLLSGFIYLHLLLLFWLRVMPPIRSLVLLKRFRPVNLPSLNACCGICCNLFVDWYSVKSLKATRWISG